MRFRTTVLLHGKTATGVEVPEDVVSELGGGKRPPVRVTINDYTYRSSVAVMGGVFLLGINSDARTGAKVEAGDEIDIDLELDTEPREVAVPSDFADALAKDSAAGTFFGGQSYSARQRVVLSVEGAKTPETRQRRIDKAIESLRSGRI